MAPAYVCRTFAEYVRLVGLCRIVAFPHHPETSRKVERDQRTLKGQVNLVVRDTPTGLNRAEAPFVDYDGHHRYHKGLANVRPADVYYGRREEMLRRSREVKQRTLALRRDFDQAVSKREARRSIH